MNVGRLDRRELLKAGIATAGLAVIPELRAVQPLGDLKYSAEYVATETLNIMQANLPLMHRAYAGFGRDGDQIVLDGTDYELQHRYVMFELLDEDEQPDTESFVNLHLMPVALALANQFKNQPDLKHLISRRLEPAPGNTGVVSHFAFRDSMGLRATIGYTIGDPRNTKPRTIYSIDMLIGVLPEAEPRRQVA